MLFNSFQFLLFFPLVASIHFWLPGKYRWAFLLFSSCVFYMFFIPYYILILLVTIAIDYIAAIYIEKSTDKRKKGFLILSIVSTCAVLAFFKYFYFLTANITYLSHYFHFSFSQPLLKIILPIGLSFHTFQSLSYVIEVYRGKQKAEKHFGIYALYVMFFPQLVAGPIERPQNLLWQFRSFNNFDYSKAVSGLKLIAWGLFKKVVVADRLAVTVNNIYTDPSGYSGFPLIFATIFFAIQIYSDFSGYSDIARGCARVLGYDLMLNFRNPYFSKSVGEFWRRWHISLSTWFKDYVFIPLGGSKVPLLRRCFNLLITFSISGLWHGASWNFVIWGFLNGLFLCFEVLFSKVKEQFRFLGSVNLKWLGFFSAPFTFFTICLTWVFFRAKSLNDAYYIISHFHLGLTKSALVSFLQGDINGIGLMQLLLAIVSISILFTVNYIHARYNVYMLISRMKSWQRWSVYYSVFLLIVFWGYFQDKNPFIYFQF
jgi:alginate O-acetyltransferase complex protein AlgI